MSGFATAFIYRTKIVLELLRKNKNENKKYISSSSRLGNVSFLSFLIDPVFAGR